MSHGVQPWNMNSLVRLLLLIPPELLAGDCHIPRERLSTQGHKSNTQICTIIRWNLLSRLHAGCGCEWKVDTCRSWHKAIGAPGGKHTALDMVLLNDKHQTALECAGLALAATPLCQLLLVVCIGMHKKNTMHTSRRSKHRKSFWISFLHPMKTSEYELCLLFLWCRLWNTLQVSSWRSNTEFIYLILSIWRSGDSWYESQGTRIAAAEASMPQWATFKHRCRSDDAWSPCKPWNINQFID